MRYRDKNKMYLKARNSLRAFGNVGNKKATWRHVAFTAFLILITGCQAPTIYQLVYQDNQYQLIETQEKTWRPARLASESVAGRQDTPVPESCDFNGQKLRFELEESKLSILMVGEDSVSGDQTVGRLPDREIWSSPQEYQISSWFCADVDNDQVEDLGLILWKTGYYGDDLPNFVNENIEDYGQHLFLYNLEVGEDSVSGDQTVSRLPELTPKWHSSTLSAPIQSLVVHDLNQDGFQELIMIEEAEDQNQLAIWQWDDWGFSKKYQNPNLKDKNFGMFDNKLLIQ